MPNGWVTGRKKTASGYECMPLTFSDTVSDKVHPDRWRHLAEIHAAPEWLWSALTAAMLPSKDEPRGWHVDMPLKWSHM
jgi:hypothetical protein